MKTLPPPPPEPPPCLLGLIEWKYGPLCVGGVGYWGSGEGKQSCEEEVDMVPLEREGVEYV